MKISSCNYIWCTLIKTIAFKWRIIHFKKREYISTHFNLPACKRNINVKFINLVSSKWKFFFTVTFAAFSVHRRSTNWHICPLDPVRKYNYVVSKRHGRSLWVCADARNKIRAIKPLASCYFSFATARVMEQVEIKAPRRASLFGSGPWDSAVETGKRDSKNVQGIKRERERL